MNCPFVVGSPVSGTAFAGREDLVEHVVSNFLGKVNMALLGSEGIGKSSILREADSRLQNKPGAPFLFYLDFSGCSSSDACLRCFRDRILSSARVDDSDRLRYMRTFDRCDESVLDLAQFIAMDRMGSFVVCIEHFEQVYAFPDAEAFLSVLSSHWGVHSRVSYCLETSRLSYARPLFHSFHGPFHGVFEAIDVPVLSDNEWFLFLSSAFAATGKTFSVTDMSSVLDLTQRHTAAVIRLSAMVWLHTERSSSPLIVERASALLVDILSDPFSQIYNGLSSKQIGFLRALLDGVPTFYSEEVLCKYGLGTLGNIRKMKEALDKKGILDISGRGYPTFQDPFFKVWFATLPWHAH